MSKLKFLERATKYPRETRRINLAEYHPDLEGDFIEVWVNWSREFLERSFALARESVEIRSLDTSDAKTKAMEELNDKALEFQADWLGISVADLRQIYQIDVALYDWIIDEANRLRREYVDERKKAESGSSDT
jgi:hypothetical protein